MHLINKKNDSYVVVAATLFTLALIATTSMGAAPATATTAAATTTTSNTTATNTTSLSALKLSPQPIWDEQATTTGITLLNQTHSIVDFDGNGTLTVPDTGQTIPMTNNGSAFISPLTESGETVSAYGKENVFSEDGDTSAITFYEIIRYDPATFQGKGLVIAVFDRNATGMLAPFNGMMVAGTHDEDQTTQTATITLWEWESGIPLLTGNNTTATSMEESPPSSMNTTTTTTTTGATTDESNAAAASEEQGESQEVVGGAAVAE